MITFTIAKALMATATDSASPWAQDKTSAQVTTAWWSPLSWTSKQTYSPRSAFRIPKEVKKEPTETIRKTSGKWEMNTQLKTELILNWSCPIIPSINYLVLQTKMGKVWKCWRTLVLSIKIRKLILINPNLMLKERTERCRGSDWRKGRNYCCRIHTKQSWRY